jgi:ribonuclease HI
MSLIVYCDGACSGNPGPGGWAFVFDDIEVSGSEKNTTNNKMELTAVIEALLYIKKQCDSGLMENKQFEIRTDSEYVKKGISEWIHTWKKNNWRTANKNPVKNRELWEKLNSLTEKLNPQFTWVKGHAGDHYNERCDELARNAASKTG